MLFSQFCNQAKPEYFGYSVQAQYLKALFGAAGITRHYSDSHLTSIFNGTKPFSSNTKKQFKKPVNVIPILEFFESAIEDTYLDVLIDSFGISKSIERNKKYIAGALAEQVKLFISSDEEDVPLVVPQEYKNQQIKKETANCDIGKPLYANDAVWVEKCGKTYTVGFYEVFTHTWIIHNNGNAHWHNRKLVFVNADDKTITPTASMVEIKIPDTTPYGIAKISVNFDSRGDENTFFCKWEMRDEDGNNCFPDSRWVFDITINVVPKFNEIGRLD